MIVQASAGELPAKVIPMRDHLSLVGQLGRGFGNSDFAPLAPRALMEFAVANHDAGWLAVDRDLGVDPQTHLPPNLLGTPLDELVKTGPGSASFNEAHHPLCGLIVSMHACGLLNGRYGLSDKVVVDVLPEAAQPMFERMLDTERRRQERLKAELAADPVSRPWIEEDRLFRNYKALQFFDTLGLYFCMDPAEAREVSTFLNVPTAVDADVSVTVTPLGQGVYQVHPFPFERDPFEVTLPGALVEPDASLTRAKDALAQGTPCTETITLVGQG